MIESVHDLDRVSMRDVYARYPDFDIDARVEQALCESHEVIVFQHPIQWYGCPALMKEWIDCVFAYGWAHGSDGTKLRGKSWLSAITAGWAERDYRPDGRNQGALSDFLAPLSQTAVYCGMRWLEPLVLYGSRHADSAHIQSHALVYRQRLLALRDGLA
jgi:glutathione-regulated potassium-efflux system ancillary protein KefG